MKKNLFILLIVSLLFSCNRDDINDKSKRNEKWAWWVDSKDGIGRWVKIGETTVHTGYYTAFYFNGAVAEKGKLVEGKKSDTIFQYDLNGQLQRYRLVNGDTTSWYFIKDGHQKVYFANGKLCIDAKIINHDYGVPYTEYHENGTLKITKNYVRDTGWCVYYFDNGFIKDSDYHAGSVDLNIKAWNDKGQLIIFNHFKDGIETGVSETFYDNGNLKDSGLVINGVREGITKGWHENGQLKFISKHRNGMLTGEQYSFHDNGKVKTIGFAKDNELIGECKQYDEDGKLIIDRLYKDGIVVKDLLTSKTK